MKKRPFPRPGPVTTTWILTLTMAAFGAAIASSRTGQPAVVGPGVHWPVMLGAFLVAELTAVHLPTRRGAHTLFMVELPLVVFLATSSDPAELFWARVGASAIYVLFIRRRDPLKVSFNAASAGLSAAAALVVHGLAAGERGVDEPLTWIGLLLGALAAGVVSAGSVSAVLTIFDPTRSPTEWRQELMIGGIQSGVAGLAGVIVVMGLAVNPLTLVFTAGIIVAALAGLTVYGGLHRRHSDLTTLYSFSVGLDPRAAYHDMLASMAHLIVEGMRAEHVAVVTSGPDGRAVATRWSRGTAGSVYVQRPQINAALEWGTSRILSDGATAEALFGEGVDRFAMAPLGDGADPMGVVLVADRPSDELAFDDHDLELLATMALHGGLNLERAVLENRLRGEIEANRLLLASKDRLIAAVSHELRTPLTGVLGFAQVLTDPDLPQAERLEMTASIASEAQDIANIVEDLLTAARFESGGLAYKPERVDISELAARVVELARARTDTDIACELEQAWALADGPRVRQVLRNLLTNAIRYGGRSITVRSFVDDTAVHLQVCDDGAGLSENDLHRIFLPYQTAHDPATQPGSVGLGLTIARELARMMGGDLTVATSDGWTVFDLTLPVASTMRSIA